jgi:AraC family transcriptional activator of pobA
VPRKIPNYSVYGESARPPWYDAFNFEWIAERSAPNDWHIEAHRHDALLQFLYIRGGGDNGEVVIESTRIRIEPPCVIMLPAQTVHGFNFAPDVDGLVVTAAQRSLEALASMVAPALLPVLQAAGVTCVSPQAAHDSALMPLVELLEKEYRAMDRGHMAAGLPLLMLDATIVGNRSETCRAPHEPQAHIQRDRAWMHSVWYQLFTWRWAASRSAG